MTVTAEAFSVRLGDRTLLPAVDLTAAAGQLTVIAATSGGGKTTLLRALLGAVPQGATVSGTLSVVGSDPLRLDGGLRTWRRTSIAYASQDPGAALSPIMSVRRLVRGADPAADPVELLERLGLNAALLNRRIGELSGGQARRVALACAAARATPVLLLDEPTAGLDAEARARVTDLLAELRDAGRTLLVATHDPATAQVADQTVQLGTPLTTRPQRTAGEHTDQPVLALRDLSAAHRSRGATPVISGFDLDLYRGEITALVGESGSGKTTIARTLAGVHPYATGSLQLDGAAVPLTGKRRRGHCTQIQYVAQDPRSALNPARTVEQTLTRAVRLHRGTGAAEARKIAAALLSDVDLPESVLTARPATLSGGQRQRIAIARALAAEPGVLIADEITSALDHASADRVLDTLTALAADRGLSILLISHDLSLVAQCANRVIDLDIYS
ncbi:ABC transporter ATP-binding protein [Glycomyces algeriensis]|uniref:Glutathione ABC transporter ATP-binding protein n=1 Tax=Glycomyces algeriensis TaxID=256037 RepID=A0A9W6G9M6_9ACTN|nr:ATP-binding cassette domain-containing protein [Glycomyces algeriensis]MDA1364303.1 ATP-binding cassette domain-containing protein [Glycomyces algeriensis]MDR7350335.1 peptide/nickel transport system ATP-binding protein [Glycomyces algeriensis]GLI43041.1 glutathione ABC transporter ATP-binding protein [Glycomyces algeriensis]